MREFTLTASEKRIVKLIRKSLSSGHERYDFWFLHNGDGTALTWEGGYTLSINFRFRNKYSILVNDILVENW